MILFQLPVSNWCFFPMIYSVLCRRYRFFLRSASTESAPSVGDTGSNCTFSGSDYGFESFRIGEDERQKLLDVPNACEKLARMYCITQKEWTSCHGGKVVEIPIDEISPSPHITAESWKKYYEHVVSFEEWCSGADISSGDRLWAAAIISALYVARFGQVEHDLTMECRGVSGLVWVLAEEVRCLKECLSACLSDMHATLAWRRVFTFKFRQTELWQYLFANDLSEHVYLDLCLFQCLLNITASLFDAADRRTKSDPHGCLTTCSGCGALLDEHDKKHRKRCGGCRGIAYCSQECQIKDWPLHKLVCSKVRKATERRNKDLRSRHRHAQAEVDYVRAYARAGGMEHFSVRRFTSVLLGIRNCYPSLWRRHRCELLKLPIDAAFKLLTSVVAW